MHPLWGHVFPSDEALLEAMIDVYVPWDDLQHRSFILSEDTLPGSGIAAIESDTDFLSKLDHSASRLLYFCIVESFTIDSTVELDVFEDIEVYNPPALA